MSLTGPARSTREKVADVHCGIGSLEAPRRPVSGVWQITSCGAGATRGASGAERCAGGRSC